MTKQKNFKIPGDQIREIAPGYGGCLATDKIVVDGEPVRYMYREEADHDADSGWRFAAGTESEEYMDEVDNHGVYDVNTIANYDPAIVPLLDAAVGSTFERTGAGEFVQIEARPPAQGEEQTAVFPIVEGTYQMTSEWSITLPGPYRRRIEDESLVLWRPGLTAWILIWDKPASEPQADRLAMLREDVAPQGFDPVEESSAGLLRFSYRLDEEGSDAGVPALHTFAIGERGHVQMAVYFDDENDLEEARGLWRSLRESAGA
jgi:hypothetical protein